MSPTLSGISNPEILLWQRVLDLRRMRLGFITDVHGLQWPENVTPFPGLALSGGASFEITWVDGECAQHIPEGVLRGGEVFELQWGQLADDWDKQALDIAFRARQHRLKRLASQAEGANDDDDELPLKYPPPRLI